MTRITAFNPIHVRAQLDAGLAQTALEVSLEQRSQLVEYLSLMAKWNHVYNLSAIRDADKMVSHHLLDSLVILPILEEWITDLNMSEHAISVLDVGTGGGLPGVVLAIMRPNWQLTLIDPVHKKTAFLQQVKGQLALTNLNVITGKVEDLPTSQSHNIITSRAFASVIDFVQLSEKALADNGFFAAMKGVFPEDEMAELHRAFIGKWNATSVELHVPQLDAQRHLIQLKRS
ncbi:16S rRNA (guanine(527)-N(7))-methyltransferase RsmG [Hydromonas duriensis]|uniref:Ribosomal RNA small subunit methyltransferase G n=1 Tax=Hydromonas duriensis TaxID=1527608 RepID=A0A4V3DK36_9BURK|nr:16S rRNA (guanine(527)-N(7))-methyltransferase RsmG [Hydromonas duriensis]TDR32523.1 16S rRNA m(7)G-527 methyltransferase [Hydromonas duriensis]